MTKKIKKMTKKEVIKILRILETADGGCRFCVTDLYERFKEEFPEFSQLADKMLKRFLEENDF